MRILIVEPDKLLGNSFADMLSSEGHDVVCAQTAQDAISKADNRSPELVFLEPMMARHNGIEFLYEFRSYTEWRNVPLVFLCKQSVADFDDFEVLRSTLGVEMIFAKSEVDGRKLIEIVDQVSSAQ